MAGVTPTPIQSSIPVDLKKRIREMQHSTHTGSPGDLEDNKKRWLVVGICLHSILSPSLRTWISQVVNNLYNALKISDLIDIQKHPRYLRKYGVANFELNYETINNNKSTYGYQRARYDYTVHNGVDLSKLFLQTHMAHYTAFDESCDSSALLGLIVNIDKFPVNVQTAARDVRSAVRNSWAHCNFTEWDTMKFNSSLQQIEDFIYLLKLSGPDESQIIGELNKWRTNGSSFFQGTTIGLEIVDDIRQQIQVLVEYAEVICKSGDTEFSRVQTELKEMGKLLCQSDKRILTLENTIATHGRALATQGQILATQEQALLEYTSLNDADVTEIERWKKRNKDFIITEIVTDIIEILEINHCVLLSGVSGTGKTITAHNVALHLCHENGNQVIPCINVKDIKTKYKDNVRQIFFLDDICGKYTANMSYIENWLQIEEFVTYILDKDNTKILATSRTEILREEHVKQSLKLFQKPYDLTINYSTADKIKIARKYVKEDEQILTDIVMKCEFSPLMCFLYSQHGDFDVREFLNSPYKTFSDEWNTLKTVDKEKFCVLLLCVIYNGTINESIFDVTNDFDKEERRNFKVIFECCNLSRGTSRFAIKDKLNTCVGTYFIKVDKEYKVIHDKMFDFLCFYFGQMLLAPILKFANIRVICERVQLESIGKAHSCFTILVSLKDEQKYIDRLIVDLKNGYIHSYLNNTQMKYKEFRPKFISVFNNLNFELQYDLVNTKDDNEINAFIVSCLRGYEDIVECFISVGADPDMLNGFFTPLTAACRDGHLATVDILLKNRASIDKTNFNGETGLFCACCCGHFDLVKYMLGKDVDINKQNKYNCTPLYVSCLAGYESIVNILIADGSIDMYFNNPLIGATLGGNYKIVETLVAKKCDVDSVDFLGRTALFIASEDGKTEIVKLLIKNNANIALVDNDAKTPLHAACCSGNTEIVKLLTNRYECVNTTDLKIETPLHKACKKGYVSIIQILLANGADINIRNRFGHSPADLATREGKIADECILKSLETTKLGSADRLIIIRNQTRKYQTQIIDTANNLLQFESTPLYEACERGDIETAQELIRNGAIVNMKTHSGRLPLVVACKQGYSILIKMLLENRADVHQALLSSIKLDSARAVRILLDISGDIRYEGHKGESLIAMACENGSLETIRILLEKGVNIKKVNEQGYKLVHAARNANSFDLSRLVIDKGLDLNIPNEDGKYPLFESIMKGLDDLSECLIHKGCSLATKETDIQTAVMSVLENGNKEISEMLVLKGYTDNLTNIDELMYYSCRLGLFNSVKYLLKNRVGIPKIYKYVYTPLILADIGGHDSLSEYLQSQECNQHRTGFTIIPYNDNVNRYLWNTSVILDVNEYTYLFNACLNGDKKMTINVQMLDRMDLNVFFKPTVSKGTFWFAQTPLCLAIRRGQNEIVTRLLKCDAMVNLTYDTLSKDDNMSIYIADGYTPLFAACQRQNYEIVDMLLRRGANLDKALYDACREGYLYTVQFLVKKGANVNAFARYGQTVLYAACISGNFPIVKFLLKQGAIIERFVGKCRQIEHLSCLHVACIGGNHQIFQLLLDRGLSVRTVSNYNRPVLHTACIEGNYEIVKMLIDRGVNTNVSNANGCTALMACVIKQEYQLCDNVIYLEIDKEPDYYPYPFGKGSLHHPEHKLLTDKHYKMIQLLIENGANIDQTDVQGRSVLFHASKIGEIKLVEMLLSNGADMNLRTKCGNTPASIARANRHMAVVNVFEKREYEQSSFRLCTLL